MIERAARTLIAVVLVCTATLSAPPVEAGASSSWPSGSIRVSLNAERVSGSDRYATSVEVALRAFPGWKGVDHVVVASGEDRALSDPLAAAGLCGVLEAPLLLVHTGGVPASVRYAIRGIPADVTVIVVGGTDAVPDSVARELGRIPGVKAVERIPGRDRYDTARRIAVRMNHEVSKRGESGSGVVLLANGEDPATFSDALALGPVSASIGAPVLLVGRDHIPASTMAAIRELGFSRRIVAGGHRTVSPGVIDRLRAQRWAGSDRYATATEVSRQAIGEGWAEAGEFALAAQLVDALCGGPFLATRRGTLLLTESERMPRPTARELARQPSSARVTVLGGPRSVADSVLAELRGSPARPAILDPSASGYVARRGRVIVRTGVNTTQLRIYHGSRHVDTRSVGSFETVDLGITDLPRDVLRVEARNPDGRSAAAERRLRHLDYPASTSIVIDKSDFRLYWVRNDVLVSDYPVAIGRTTAETPVGTWRIDSKYRTAPTSVYGPRKMRMYRKVGSGYVYTAYNIHGTNQPWAIGTKVSAGCIRMFNDDVLELFPQVPLGTIVVTRE